MPPRSLVQSSSSVLHLPGCRLFPLPLSLLFLSFLSLFFLSSSLLWTSVWSHLLSLPFFHSSFFLSHLLLSSPVPLSLPPSLLSLSPLSPSCMSYFLLFFLHLFSLQSKSFKISVSLANSDVRQSIFQHPKHWNVNPSSVVSDQVFSHPDTAKSTKLWQWLHTKCLLAFTCRLQGAILRFLSKSTLSLYQLGL